MTSAEGSALALCGGRRYVIDVDQVLHLSVVPRPPTGWLIISLGAFVVDEILPPLL